MYCIAYCDALYSTSASTQQHKGKAMSNPNKDRLSEQVVIRVNIETKQKLEAIAEKQGIKHTALVRDILMDAIGKYTSTGNPKKKAA